MNLTSLQLMFEDKQLLVLTKKIVVTHVIRELKVLA